MPTTSEAASRAGLALAAFAMGVAFATAGLLARDGAFVAAAVGGVLAALLGIVVIRGRATRPAGDGHARAAAETASRDDELARARIALEEVRTSLAEAERTRHLASLGEASAVIAHEIRNPIAAAKGHTQLLVEMARNDPKVLAKAQRIEAEIVRLERLTDDLLVFARSGKLRTRRLDLRPLVAQAAATVDPSLETEVPYAPLEAEVDAGRMLQVLENLGRNAARHGRPPIRITLRDEGSDAVIVVRDHGPGIPKERIESIFEPFVTDATRGTGLGLAVVRRVIDMHGGSVRAANHPDGGAEFTLRLPRAPGT